MTSQRACYAAGVLESGGYGGAGLVLCPRCGRSMPVQRRHGARAGEPYMIGCYTRPWAQYDYRVALDAIAEAGYKYVGLMTTKAKKNS